MTQTLKLALGERSYPIHIGENLLSQWQLIEPAIKAKQLLVITNETIAPLYLDSFIQNIPASYQVDKLILPDGEQYKTLATLEKIFDHLLRSGHKRNTTVVALGGGVIGDMAGFAAASYQRGVDFVQVPTTLLAQVDSSVGGKTAVNHPLGKNMIGAFHQPKAVIIDINTLKTLPKREFNAGIAEVIKYGLIQDRAFFSWLVEHATELAALSTPHLIYAIKQSCQCKADTVAADEKEQGVRAYLNLGHTFGHAIENILGYGTWLHGEAVATGMCLALRLSQKLGFISEQDVAVTEQLLQNFELPTKLPDDFDSQRMLAVMKSDKKMLDDNYRLILLKAIGDAFIAENMTAAQIKQVL